MNQLRNKEEIAKILDELINVLSSRKLDKANPQQYNRDIAPISKWIEQIAEFRKQELKQQLGANYEEIDFSLYSSDENTLGGYISNVGFNENRNTIIKVPRNHQIQLNISKFSEIYLESNNQQARIFGCMKLIDTIFHEFRHFEQNCNKQNPIIDINAINSAKQDILLHTKYDDVYDENYWNMDDEIDARLTSHDMTIEILEKVQKQDKAYLKKIFEDRRSTEIDETRENAILFHEGKEGKDQDKQSFFNQRVDEFIENHPDVLDIYKSLQVEYNKDGKKKSNLQLINDLKKHLKGINGDKKLSEEQKKTEKAQIRNVYFDILADRLQDMTREEAIEFEKSCGIEGKGGTKAFYDLMKKHYIEVYDKKVNDLEKLQDIIDKKGLDSGIKDNIDSQRQILDAKYKRMVQTVLNLSASVYKAEGNIINGVDIGYVAPTKLSDEDQQTKDRMVRKVIEIYDQIETDEDFKKRQNLENKYISQVLNSVELQRCSQGFMNNFELNNNKNFTEEQLKVMMRALKAADALTIEGGRDYLSEFTKVPFINDTLVMMSKDPKLKAMRDSLSNQPTNKEVKKTLADNDKIIADKHLKSGDLKSKNAKEELRKYGRQSFTNGYNVMGNSEWERKKLAMWRVTARQQGFKIGQLSKTDDYGLRRLSLENDSSCIINLDDLKKFAKSDMVVECVVNGRKYEATKFKSMEGQAK